MEIVQQLAVFLDNRPGALSRICTALAEAKINIYALTTSDTIDHTVLRMVVSEPRRTIDIIEERGALVVDDEVLMLDMGNKPGGLADIAARLSKAKMNIEYCYASAAPRSRKGVLILRVSDPHKAIKILSK